MNVIVKNDRQSKMKIYILLILSFSILSGCSPQIDTIEIQSLVVQEMIKGHAKENYKIINIDFDSCDDKSFNIIVNKLNHPELIIRRGKFEKNVTIKDDYFVDNAGNRIIFFSMGSPYIKGKTIIVEISFYGGIGRYGVFRYILEIDGNKYKIVGHKVVRIA